MARGPTAVAHVAAQNSARPGSGRPDIAVAHAMAPHRLRREIRTAREESRYAVSYPDAPARAHRAPKVTDSPLDRVVRSRRSPVYLHELVRPCPYRVPRITPFEVISRFLLEAVPRRRTTGRESRNCPLHQSIRCRSGPPTVPEPTDVADDARRDNLNIRIRYPVYTAMSTHAVIPCRETPAAGDASRSLAQPGRSPTIGPFVGG
jgi:hypothetical protein